MDIGTIFLQANMVASQVTEENIKSAEDVIKDSVDYIFEKINEK